MKERGILFSAPMVRAILEGRKTQTRRVVSERLFINVGGEDEGENIYQSNPRFGEECLRWVRCPYGAPGDRLWVKETHAYKSGETQVVAYRENGQSGAWFHDGGGGRFFLHHGWVTGAADNSREGMWFGLGKYGGRWRPSIFMPRWASRIDLDVTRIRVERLHDITEQDARAEGIDSIDGLLDDAAICKAAKVIGAGPEDARGWFAALWAEINGWDSLVSNPWLWVVDFTTLRRGVGE